MHDMWSNQVIFLQLIALTIFPIKYKLWADCSSVSSNLPLTFSTIHTNILLQTPGSDTRPPSLFHSHCKLHMKMCFTHFTVYILWHHTGRQNIWNWILARIPPNFIFVKLLYFLKFWVTQQLCISNTMMINHNMTLWDNRMLATYVRITEGTAHRQNNSVATGLTACH